jgi:hypothetical protein
MVHAEMQRGGEFYTRRGSAFLHFESYEDTKAQRILFYSRFLRVFVSSCEQKSGRRL